MSTTLAQPAQAPVVRTTTQDRWDAASKRAQLANVIVTEIDDLGTYRVTSASHPGVSYESDGIHCTCQAAAFGDSVCLHRAAVRDHQAAQKPCSVCGGCGWEHVSIWDWRTGHAVDLYSIRCSCQTEPVPPAPAADLTTKLERELTDATAALAEIDERLRPYNEAIEYGTRRLNVRDHDRLLRRREVAQQRVWDAQDAIERAENVQVAA